MHQLGGSHTIFDLEQMLYKLSELKEYGIEFSNKRDTEALGRAYFELIDERHFINCDIAKIHEEHLENGIKKEISKYITHPIKTDP